MSAGKKSDYFADRIRAELAFARSRGARDPEALAQHLNARGFLTRDGQALDRRRCRGRDPPVSQGKARELSPATPPPAGVAVALGGGGR